MSPASAGGEVLGRPKDEKVFREWRRTQHLRVWWVLFVGLAACAVLLAAGMVKWAVFALGVGFLASALARLALPRGIAGGLVVRSRTVDVAMLLAAGAALCVMAWAVKIPQGW